MRRASEDYYAVRRISMAENARLRTLFTRYGALAGLSARKKYRLGRPDVKTESKLQALYVEFMRFVDSIANGTTR